MTELSPPKILDVALAGHPGATELKAAMLSDKFVSIHQDLIASSPHERRRRELVVAYGNRHGGTVLQLLQLFEGPYWGTGLELTFDQCALVLGETPEKLAIRYDEMLDEIRPLLALEDEGGEVKRSGFQALRFVKRSKEASAEGNVGKMHTGRGKRRKIG